MWPKSLILLAGTTRLELATSDVTGRRSNQTELRPRKDFQFLFFWLLAKKLLANGDWLKAILMVGGTGFEPATPGL